LEPEILVVDEVLAVGDANFQRKCLGKMKDVAGHGRTILFVSHDMSAVRRLCRRVVLLEKGKVTAVGLTEDVVPRYMGDESALLIPGEPRDVSTAPRSCTSGDARFTEVSYQGSGAGNGLISGGSLTVDLAIQATSGQKVDSLAVWLADRSGTRLVYADTTALGEEIVLKEGMNRVAIRIDAVHLNPGTYVLNLWLAKRPATVIDVIEHAAEIEVVEPPSEMHAPVPGNGVVHCRFSLVGSNS
jgi:lipopolysaccharide transport system ATP-binding protein